MKRPDITSCDLDPDDALKMLEKYIDHLEKVIDITTRQLERSNLVLDKLNEKLSDLSWDIPASPDGSQSNT